jgi:Zn finger protein HypA/HybF involved in hydrogenase expression
MTDPKHQQERMRAIIDQALAHLRREGPAARLAEVHLDVYSGIDPHELAALFADSARGTPAEHATLIPTARGSRYICWNCCGMRFEGWQDVCPNCGETALEVPQDISFALYKVTFSRGD